MAAKTFKYVLILVVTVCTSEEFPEAGIFYLVC